MSINEEISFTIEQQQENDKFNYLGAISVLELSSKKNLFDLIEDGDWHCLPDVYTALSRVIVDKETKDDNINGRDITDAYFEIIKRKMGVACDSMEDVTKVLLKIKNRAEEDEKLILDSMIEHFNNDQFIDMIMIGSKIVGKGTVISSLVHDCSDLVIRSITFTALDSNSDSDSDE